MASGKKAGTQLVELFEKAVKAADRVEDDVTGEAEEMRCIEAIMAMRAIPVTTSLLMDTQVGKRLRKLTKHKSFRICSSAQEVIDAWKKIVATEAAAKSSSTPSGAKKSPAKEPLKSPGLKAPTATYKVDKTTKSEVSLQVKTSVTTTMNRPLANGNPRLGQVPKSGDSTRDKIRELLVEAFSKVISEAQDEYLERAKSSDLVQAAVTTENAMFKNLGLSSSTASKSKYRSLLFNLKDPKNPDLRRRVLLGEIAAEELLTLSVEDMASDERKRENQNIQQKALRECERGLKAAASTDQFKCAKCKERKCTYFQMQTRSADEPMTTFVTCVNCNNHWKFC